MRSYLQDLNDYIVGSDFIYMDNKKNKWKRVNEHLMLYRWNDSSSLSSLLGLFPILKYTLYFLLFLFLLYSQQKKLHSIKCTCVTVGEEKRTSWPSLYRNFLIFRWFCEHKIRFKSILPENWFHISVHLPYESRVGVTRNGLCAATKVLSILLFTPFPSSLEWSYRTTYIDIGVWQIRGFCIRRSVKWRWQVSLCTLYCLARLSTRHDSPFCIH